MIRLIDEKVFYLGGEVSTKKEFLKRGGIISADSSKWTIAAAILDAHNKGDNNDLRLSFDALASHDITYVGIIQTAKASGLTEFPVPYILTNCHNSLCAVGGTINEDDHVFGLSAAKKYGGIYVPANQAVIHSYMREMLAAPSKMILGSDSHTRYGALGTLGIGEGGPELVKQLLKRTYDLRRPEVIAVQLSGSPRRGVGPQDVALAIIKAVFKNGFVKNKILEFVGGGIDGLSVEYRNAIDVMTTETTCLSSVWRTDGKVKEYLEIHGRGGDFKTLEPKDGAAYDGAVICDLSHVEPMIALPFHPSNVYTVRELCQNAGDIFRAAEIEGKQALEGKTEFKLTDKIQNGKIVVSQGIIAGCAGGTFDNIYAASKILSGGNVGNGAFNLSVYPGSQPNMLELVRCGAAASLIASGAVIKPAFCGPCFGAGDVPCNNGFSVRHTTRNFASREGSKPGDKQIASVALLDARSIAATALSGGVLTSALDIDYDEAVPKYHFDQSVYGSRIYSAFGKADDGIDLIYGPNIADWPAVPELASTLALKTVAVINDPVTTTDELIPSGETSSYRSNPLRLSEFTLSRKVPEYVARAKAVSADRKSFEEGKEIPELNEALELAGATDADVTYGSVIFAVKPGDGSAREQAASCQRVLGGAANIAREYATKRYRSNLINWGMVPFVSKDTEFEQGDYVIIKNIREHIKSGAKNIPAVLVRRKNARDITLVLDTLTDDEKQIILDGCLMNYYKKEL